MDEKPGNIPQALHNSAFTLIPDYFTAHLSPEQFRALQQVYQTVYEKAKSQVEETEESYVPPIDYLFGDGI